MKRAYRVLAACACAFAVLHCPGTVRAEQDAEAAQTEVRTGIVTSNVLNVRARPATHYEVVCQIKQGTEVKIVGEHKDWFEILAPKHAKAYVAKRFIGPDDTITGERVRVHAGPGVVFTTFGHVNKGDSIVRIGDPVKEWQKIESPADATVWVSQAYVQVEEPPVPPPEEVVAEGPEVAVKEGPAAAETTAPAAQPPATGEAAEAPPDKPTPSKAGSSPHTEAIAELTLPPPILRDKQTPGKKPDTPEQKPDAVLVPPLEAPAETAADESPEPARQGVEIPPPAPPARDASASSPVVKPATGARTGVVFALSKPVPGIATHFLALRIHSTCYPVCYLRSKRLDLIEWELREVRVEGKEIWYPGWQRAVVEVSGIQINR